MMIIILFYILNNIFRISTVTNQFLKEQQSLLTFYLTFFVSITNKTHPPTEFRTRKSNHAPYTTPESSTSYTTTNRISSNLATEIRPL